MLYNKWVWQKNKCYAGSNDEALFSFPKWRWILKCWAFTCLCIVAEIALFSVCTREPKRMKRKTPCCLPQHSRAVLPIHSSVEPGSGSGLQLQCCVPAAHVLSWAVEALLWGGLIWSHQSILLLEIWLSASLLSAKWRNNNGKEESLKCYILKCGRFFFLAVVSLLHVSVDCNSWWDPSGSLPSLFCLFRPSVFHPLFPLRAVLAGQTCSRTCCWSEVLSKLAAGRKEGRMDECSCRNTPDLLLGFTPSSPCSNARWLTSKSAVLTHFLCLGLGASDIKEKLRDWRENKKHSFPTVLYLVSLPVAVAWDVDTATPSPAQLCRCWMYSSSLKEILFFLSLPWGQKSFRGPFNYCRLLWLKFPL